HYCITHSGRYRRWLLLSVLPRARLPHALPLFPYTTLFRSVVGLEDLTLQVGDEHRVGGILDQAFGVGPRLVQLAHVAEDADGADDPALRVTQRRGVERRRDGFARGAAGVESGVAGHTLADHFAQRRGELARLLGADELGQGLLDELVWPDAEQLGDGFIPPRRSPHLVGDEHRVGRVLDQALGVGAGLVQFAHVAEDADGPDHPAVRVPQRRGVERRRDGFARGAAGVEPGVAGHALGDHFAQGRGELPRLLPADEARQ